ncbi:hypothetical protein TWF694_011904 [Orbilia ellipsospora]
MGKAPSKHSFFGDRNPREREWMDPGLETKPGGSFTRRNSGFWEGKSSSEEDAPRVSTFYAFTPRTRLRTNIRDTSPEKSTSRGSTQNSNSNSTDSKGPTLSPTERNVSPHRSTTFTRAQSTREPKDHTDHSSSIPVYDRRKSGPSAGSDGTERRKFSYLFNEDGIRKPQRVSKQTPGSDHDEDEEAAIKGRNMPLRQPYSTSRRNTLDRDGTQGRPPGESRNGNGGLKHADRQRFSTHPTSKAEEFQSPLNSFKSFESNMSSPISLSEKPINGNTRPKSFSLADWNTVFSGEQNIFAVPVRKGQQSPRKGPTMPKIQTNLGSGAVRLNFSRPRPASASAGANLGPSDMASDWPFSSKESLEEQESEQQTKPQDTFSQNAFAFEAWEKAFTDSNPFDVNPSHHSGPGSTNRSTSRHRKGATRKKSTGSFAHSKSTPADEALNAKDPTPKMTNDGPHTSSTRPVSMPTPPIQKDTAQSPHAPSPIAMDIDSPRGNTTPTPAVPITPTQKKPSTLRQSRIFHSPTVSDEEPVSPIKGDAQPISPLRSDEVPQKEDDANGNVQTRSYIPFIHTESEKRPPAAEPFLNMEALRNIEPIIYSPSNGLNGHWKGVHDALPFESKPAPFPNISSPPLSSKQPLNIPNPPEFPQITSEKSTLSYDKHCAAMTVYQAHWNEYNAKIINHIRARLEVDILRCAQNKGFATGSIGDKRTGVHADLIQTRKKELELDEDRQIRAAWEAATEKHQDVLAQWRLYLERLQLADTFD